jgi:hypothetical protein
MATKSKKTVFMGLEFKGDVDERLLKWGGILLAEVVIVVVLSLLIVLPQIAAIQEANADLRREQENLAQLQEKAELLANFSVEFATQERVLLNTFPQDRDIGLILRSIRQITNQEGVELVTYIVRPSEAGAQAASSRSTPSLMLELTINASAQGTQNFVNGINESLPLKRIDNFSVVRSLVASGSGGLDQLIQTKLELSAFYLPFDIRVDATRPLQPFGNRQLETLNQLSDYTLPPAGESTTDPGVRNPTLFGQ